MLLFLRQSLQSSPAWLGTDLKLAKKNPPVSTFPRAKVTRAPHIRLYRFLGYVLVTNVHGGTYRIIFT